MCWNSPGDHWSGYIALFGSQCQSGFCPPWQERRNSSDWDGSLRQSSCSQHWEQREQSGPVRGGLLLISQPPAKGWTVFTTGHKLGTRRSTHNPVVDISDSNITVTVEGKVKKPFTRNHVLLFPVSSCYELRVGVDYCLKKTEGNLDRKKIS